MKSKQVKIREQTPLERIKNFYEVCLGYNKEEAKQEAARCTQCGQCKKGCPVQIDIPAFIHFIKEEKFAEAEANIKEANALPGVCGRVCPQETQCEMYCPLGKKGEPVAIGKLERFCSDWALQNNKRKVIPVKSNQIKVAVFGSGPSGLTCAGELAKMGYEVTIFESFHLPGGVLRYGIPEFRLPNQILDAEINYIKELGVDIIFNVLIGKTLTLDDLQKQGYHAVFIAVGTGLPNFMNISGENLNGVFSSSEFLTRNNLMLAYEKNALTPIHVKSPVVVVGGGNVAIDAARVARRYNAEVMVVYRRTEKEMPARIEEIQHAKEERIIFHFLTNPVKVIGDEKGWIKQIKCIKMELGTPDEKGRRSTHPIPDTEFLINASTMIIAIGQKPNPLISQAFPGLKLSRYGTIETDEKMMTSKPGVFAGGDIVSGAATVISAMEMGKKAAKAMDQWLKQQK